MTWTFADTRLVRKLKKSQKENNYEIAEPVMENSIKDDQEKF